MQFFETPYKFTLRDKNNSIYFYRYLPNGCKNIRVNIPDEGVYSFDNDALLIRKPLKINSGIYSIKLPPHERDRVKDYFIKHDPNQTKSPALIYTGTGMIVTGANFGKYPPPIRVFILLHELAHFRYKTEKYCDLWAFVEFVKMGYNPSTAIYCLTDVLKSNAGNDERINYLYDKMVQSEIIK